MVSQYMKIISTLLVIREVKIKTTVSTNHFVPTWMVIIHKRKIISVGEEVEKLEPTCISD